MTSDLKLSQLRSVPQAAAVSLIALAPLAGLPFPFELGMRIQAGLISVVLGVLLVQNRGRIGRLLKSAPAPVLWGMSLYSIAAIWGLSVGLAAGNPFRYLLSQAVSMLLFPAAFLAFSTWEKFRSQHLLAGLVVASTIGLAVHVAALLIGGFDHQADSPIKALRFELPHGISFTGLALLVLMLSLASWLDRKSPLTLLGLLTASFLIIGGLSRGEWVATGLGFVIVVGVNLSFQAARPMLRWALLLMLMAALTGSILAWGKTVGSPWIELPLPMESGRLPTAEGKRELSLGESVPVSVSAVEFQVLLYGEPGAEVVLWLRGRAEDGSLVVKAKRSQTGSGAWQKIGSVVFLPTETETITVGARASKGRWRIGRSRFRGFHWEISAWVRGLLDGTIASSSYLTEGAAPLLLRWGRGVGARVSQMTGSLRNPTDDPTLDYRFREWRQVLDRWQAASLSRKVLGHGLGATFEFSNRSWTPSGEEIRLERASYIHNFYLFLGFKLGVAGLAGLAGLLIIVGWSTRELWIRRRDLGNRWLFLGATSTWMALLLWSVASPEILNFRLAPLWGILVAACSQPRHLDAPDQAVNTKQ